MKILTFYTLIQRITPHQILPILSKNQTVTQARRIIPSPRYDQATDPTSLDQVHNLPLHPRRRVKQGMHMSNRSKGRQRPPQIQHLSDPSTIHTRPDSREILEHAIPDIANRLDDILHWCRVGDVA